jgi:tRNA 5-methylaminomethyl-2-thiouridine biosynthesis bifunctional protein
VTGRVELDGEGVPCSPEFGDRYHPRQGALAQARQVFLGGNGLPARWRGHDRFVVLETGFGLGNNFLATWRAWLDDAERCEELHFISIEARPLCRNDLAGLSRDEELATLAARLTAAWPPLTSDLHRLAFEAGRVQLLLAFGDVAAWLPQIVASIDAFYLDGFAPAKNPRMWEPRLFKAMARLAAPEATAATWSVARPVREGLGAAGFEIGLAPGSGGKREITVARFAPRFSPRRSVQRGIAIVAREHRKTRHEPVAIVGGGLAGCAAAWALAEQGRPSVLFERGAELAREGSGNAAGIFHAIVHRHDGHHARFHRAAAFEARHAVATALAAQGVRGSVAGLLRIEPRAAGAAELQATLDRLGLPEDLVRAVSPDEGTSLAGLKVAAPAWHFPGGGWVDPRGLALSYVARTAGRCEVRCATAIASIRRDGERWLLLDHSGRIAATAGIVVLANAGAAIDLLGGSAWPVSRTRGQISSVSADDWPAARVLRLPIAGSGYLLPAVEGRLWFGASSQEDDAEPRLRIGDHCDNVARLTGLLASPPSIDVAAIDGRVGFRWSSADRLPLIGAVPREAVGAALGLGADAAATSPRPDQPRFAPRAPGLFAFIGLGSRGIAASALGGRIVASWITGAPMAIEADLLDAVDPARFASRHHRRQAALRGAAV